MKIGIIGLPNSGKKTLFRLLTGIEPGLGLESRAFPGIVEVRDSRIDFLADYYNPKKKTQARIFMELMPDLDKRIILEGDIFRDIANLDAICLVVRSFKNDSIYHVNGSVNPERDVEEITGELILHDLLFIEKRLDRIAKNLKKANAEQYKKEETLLRSLKAHLEKDLPLRALSIPAEDRKIIRSYPFITLKEFIVVINKDDNDMRDMKIIENLSGKYQSHGIRIMQISAKSESEIQGLESEEERAEFMSASGIAEPAINLLSRICMEALGLISFFTVGSDEVRQWQIRKESSAPEAADAIHSDIRRGFIRAEVMKYDEFAEYGSEEKLKQAGKYYIMGKNYLVQDGDIISFRFNV